jgi:hypothetical protein
MFFYRAGGGEGGDLQTMNKTKKQVSPNPREILGGEVQIRKCNGKSQKVRLGKGKIRKILLL